MSNPTDRSLMMFSTPLALYMKRDGKQLNGITLRQESSPNYSESFWKQMGWTRCFWPVFDITNEDSRKSRESIVHQHLDNYFNCYVLDLTRRENPPILESLFVAEGTSAGVCLADLVKLGAAACAAAGKTASNSSASTSSASNSSASNSSASSSSASSSSALRLELLGKPPAPELYTYVLSGAVENATKADLESRKFMNGLNVYVQMSEAQPQLSGITVRQTPEGIRFHHFTDRGVAILGSTATQLIMHYKRTLCDAPFNFHPFYYIFVESGWGANLSLAQIINFEFLPERAGKLDGIGTNFIATWPRLTVGSKAPASAEAAPTPVATVATVAVDPAVVLDRLRAKHTVLAEEHRTLILIETQLALNQTLKDEIAIKRKVLENPECQ